VPGRKNLLEFIFLARFAAAHRRRKINSSKFLLFMLKVKQRSRIRVKLV